MSYGVFQEYYTTPHTPLQISGNIRSVGVIGTTLSGIIYLSMPFLFGLLARRLTRFRTHALVVGGVLSVSSIIASAFATSVAGLIATQGVMQAVGATLLYSASTIYIDEWYIQRKGFGYAITLAAKSTVGVVCPLAFSGMLSHIGYRPTLFIWAGILALTVIPTPFLLRRRIPLSRNTSGEPRPYRRTSWTFMKHRTFPMFLLANIVFSAAYGMPQTYLATFASSSLHFSPSKSALLIVALNLPSIFASLWIGPLSDGEPSKIFGGRRLSINSVNCLTAMGSAIPAFLLWGLTVEKPYAAGVATLVLFSIIWGFFAGGYSSTWGGIVKQISKEAQEHQEIADTGLIMGLMNGGRGIGYIVGGFAGVELLKIGSVGHSMLAYGGNFGSLIVFSGCGFAVAGLGVVVKKNQR